MLSGRIVFPYMSNNGICSIGSGDCFFETSWSQGSDAAIHAYKKRPSVEGIALAENIASISDIKDASRFDFSSDRVFPRVGEIVILHNNHGRYAAVQLLTTGSTIHGSAANNVTFRYQILPDGSRDFSKATTTVSVVDASFSKRVLLVGAGFSRNWGGLLANEVQEKIFNHPAVQARAELKKMVLEKPFEDALEETRTGRWRAEDHAAVETAIRAAFDQMDRAFRNPDPPVLNATANDFIKRFCPGPVGVGTGYVFSLNQDLLLERIYGTHVSSQKLTIPGIKWLGRPPHFPAGLSDIPEASPVADDELAGLRFVRAFNLVKLHGSINWQDGPGAPGMVMGRRKPLIISAHPLLGFYYDVFERVLGAGDVHLMVIGYGWGDDHINDVIGDAVRDHGLRVYSWGRSPPQEMIRPRHRGTEIVDGLIGYSTRPMTEVMPPKPTDPGSPEYDDLVRAFF